MLGRLKEIARTRTHECLKASASAEIIRFNYNWIWEYSSSDTPKYYVIPETFNFGERTTSASIVEKIKVVMVSCLSKLHSSRRHELVPEFGFWRFSSIVICSLRQGSWTLIFLVASHPHYAIHWVNRPYCILQKRKWKQIHLTIFPVKLFALWS